MNGKLLRWSINLREQPSFYPYGFPEAIFLDSIRSVFVTQEELIYVTIVYGLAFRRGSCKRLVALSKIRVLFTI